MLKRAVTAKAAYATSPTYRAKRVHMLRRGPNYVGIADGPYVIGFESITLARWMHYSLHPEKQLRIERTHRIDVSEDVNTQMLSLGLDTNLQVEKLTIDPEAKLIIPKMQGSALDPMNDIGLHLDSMMTEDFMMMPFSKRVGIIMPYTIDSEDGESAVLSAHVVDPCTNTSMFRSGISL